MRNETRVRKILPVNLMLEGRPCLVVGSGQIAARKVGHLLEAGAALTVVGPEACEAIRSLAAEGRIQYRPRSFKSADVKGQWLVLVVTDNATVNGAVIRLCRQKGILCSAADAHWTLADFMIPATLRRPHITLTLSTGGESCRRARLMKDYLGRHIDGLQQADLLVVSVKRPARASKRAVMELGAVLQQIWGVFEFVILNRADRLEVLAVVSARTKVATSLLRECLRARFPGRTSVQQGASAVEHVAGSASLPGGDLSQALLDSTRFGWAGDMCKDWIEAGIRLGVKHRESRAKTVAEGFRTQCRICQRQYETIIRSL
jgi:precorrin-2 dehydrogenase/sirohydrochlorin ferrochelatase